MSASRNSTISRAEPQVMKVFDMLEYVCGLLGLRFDNRGVTAVEYGIMASLIATILVAAMVTFGTGLKTAFTDIAKHLTTGV